MNSTSVNEANQWHRNGKINIPTALLSNSQPNYVSVSYENEYDKDGNGCVSFIDVDQKQYLYTQF